MKNDYEFRYSLEKDENFIVYKIQNQPKFIREHLRNNIVTFDKININSASTLQLDGYDTVFIKGATDIPNNVSTKHYLIRVPLLKERIYALKEFQKYIQKYKE